MMVKNGNVHVDILTNLETSIFVLYVNLIIHKDKTTFKDITVIISINLSKKKLLIGKTMPIHNQNGNVK